MAVSAQRSRWQRIYRQTLTLTYKNLLIFYKSPITLIFRALLFPIAIALIFSFLKHIGYQNGSKPPLQFGISPISYPVKDLSAAMNEASKHKLVLARNGISNETFSPVIEGVLSQPGMDQMNVISVNDPDELYDLCQQTTTGSSDCFAAVVFRSSNDTTVEYTIALDNDLLNGYSWSNYRTDDSLMAVRLFPLQWVLDSHLGGFSSAPKPSVRPYGGSSYIYSYQSVATPQQNKAAYWYIDITHLVSLC